MSSVPIGILTSLRHTDMIAVQYYTDAYNMTGEMVESETWTTNCETNTLG